VAREAGDGLRPGVVSGQAGDGETDAGWAAMGRMAWGRVAPRPDQWTGQRRWPRGRMAAVGRRGAIRH
jgi:hypothetical protein